MHVFFKRPLYFVFIWLLPEKQEAAVSSDVFIALLEF